MPYSLTKKKILKTFFKNIIHNEGRHLKTITFVFCNDKFLLGLNKKYLDHDFFTDVLTFDISNSKAKIVGEIYISINRVKENAIVYNTLTVNELYRVMIHGVLHLCGYNDKYKAQKIAMKLKENIYLDELNKCFT